MAPRVKLKALGQPLKPVEETGSESNHENGELLFLRDWLKLFSPLIHEANSLSLIWRTKHWGIPNFMEPAFRNYYL